MIFNYKYYQNRLHRTEGILFIFNVQLLTFTVLSLAFLLNYEDAELLVLLKYAVTEDFSCPFCLVKCASFKVSFFCSSKFIFYDQQTKLEQFL